MTEGKRNTSGEMALDAEEKIELLRTAPCAVEKCCEKGAESVQTNINSSNCAGRKSSLDNHNKNQNQFSRSKMIISGGETSSKLNIFIATCSANLAALAAGCALSWSSPTIPKITKEGEKVYITSEQGALLTSLLALGAGFGPFIASAVVNKIGRKMTIIADMVVFLISWSLLAFCTVIPGLYFARFLIGIAVGTVFTIVPMYVAETAPVHLRGPLGSFLQLFICFGFLICYCIGPFVSYLTLILICAVVPLVCVLTFAWMPESPHHLLNKDKKQDALESLQWLRGNPEKLSMQAEINDIIAAVQEARKNKGSIIVLFSSRGNIKALYYACALVFFQQMCGINVVLFYAQSIFEQTGSALSSTLSTIIIALVMTSASAFAAPLAKLFGIKSLLCISAAGDAISLGALGYFFFMKTNGSDVSNIGWLPVASLVLFIITFSIGLGPFVWVIMAEIFPAHLKAIASAVTASFCWILAFVLTRYFSIFTETFGIPAAYWMFSIFCILAVLFVVFQLPDTDGKTYQEIQEIIHGKKKLKYLEEKA